MAIKSNIYLKSYNTCIPIIQRDYVQGSDRWHGKRKAFVENLLDSLKKSEKCLLDFVYGTKSDDGFVPLDGQQRITTLNLLGWMLVQRTSGFVLPDGMALSLKYDTRDSSREFCSHLFSDSIGLAEQPSVTLKERIWFAEQWNNDPTVKAMLEMLDTLDTYLRSAEYQPYVADMAYRFFCDSPIEFEIKDLGLNGTPDDLYVKINARGKGLSDFEHWKSSFIKFLEEHHPDLKDEFEDKIEHEWCDLFWGYALARYDETQAPGSNDAADQGYPRIDEYFMRFFMFVTNILWADTPDFAGYKIAQDKSPEYDINKLDETIQESVWHEVYEKRENVQRLYKALDAATTFGSKPDEIDAYFGKLLTSYTDHHLYTAENDSSVDFTRINIFGENNKTNLFGRLIEGIDVPPLRQQALLWGILEYVAKWPGAPIDDLKSFVRVIWTYLQTYRQRLAHKMTVEANLRFYGLYDTILIMRNLLDKQDVYETDTVKNDIPFPGFGFMQHMYKNDVAKYEKDVLPLLNHPWLHCDLTNLQSVIETYDAGTAYTKFCEFVGLGNKDRITELIKSGWNGALTTSGEYYFSYGIEGGWPYIFTGSFPGFARWCAGNMSDYTSWLSEFVVDNIDELYSVIGRPFNAFYWAGGDSRQIYGIAYDSAMQLRGYKLDPVAYLVAVKAGAEFSFQIDWRKHKARMQGGSSGNNYIIELFSDNTTHNGIVIKGTSLRLEYKIDGWHVIDTDNQAPAIAAKAQEFASVDSCTDFIAAGASLLKYVMAQL